MMTALTLWSPFPEDGPTEPDPVPWHGGEEDEPTLVRGRAAAHRPIAADIECLALPAGLREDMLLLGARPKGYEQTRIWLVRLARDLAQDYREQFGIELRTNASSLEQVQRHLAAGMTPAFSGSARPRDPRAVAREVVRHGALLGEILARALDGSWADLSGDLAGEWEMVIPDAGTVRPIERVSRFVQEGMRGEDLVAFYLDLYGRTRGARSSGIYG
jgi:hypothetical protein